MSRSIFILTTLCVPLMSFAGEPVGPTVQIISPVAGVCVDNGGMVNQGLPCGDAIAQPRSVPLELNLAQPGGVDLRVMFITQWSETISELQCDGDECNEVLVVRGRSEEWSTEFEFPDGEEDTRVGQYEIPGFMVGDSPDTALTIMVQNDWLPVPGPGDDRSEVDRCGDFPEICSVDTVSFPLDRKAPTIVMCADQEGGDALADAVGLPWEQVAGECFDEAVPDVAFVTMDNLTPAAELNPVVERVTDGCRVTHSITVADSCGVGNTQQLSFETVQPAREDQVSVELGLYRCDLDECPEKMGDRVVNRAGEFQDALPDDARIDRAAVLIHVDAEPGCESSFEAVLMDADNVVEECPDIEDLEPDDEGQVNNPCTVIVEGQVIDEPGAYTARVRIGSCGVVVAEATTEFTILERPVANAGGPYEVAQGGDLMLDASQSSAPAEVGGIVQYAWDLNHDGFFNPDTEVFGPDQPQVPFDTSADGVFPVRLMVFAGNGTVDVVRFEVTVTDVDPICDAGGPYDTEEGRTLTFDGRQSRSAHGADPIVAYHWDFGDNRNPQSGAQLTQPLHIYADALNDPFEVTLTVEDIDSSSSCTTQVTVRDVVPILSDIEVLNPQAQIEGELVRFTCDAEAGSQADVISNFMWTFGLPNARREGVAERTTEWTYQDDGTYEVCVTVSDEDSNRDVCENFEIADLEPTASFTGPITGSQGQSLTFDATLTSEGGAADRLTQLVWDWGDGSPLVRTGPNERVQSHVFPQDGEFTLTLRVIDEDSAAIHQSTVTILDATPSAHVAALFPGNDPSIPEGVSLLLDASGSEPGSDTDPIVQYDWDFGNGVTRVGRQGQPGYQYAWPDQGIFEVQVTVRDVDGSEATATTVVEVTNVPPTVELVTESRQVAIGEPVRFETISGALPARDGQLVFAVVDDVAGDLPPPPGGVLWNMGDGTTINAATHEYVFNELGRKRITVEVSDGDGGTSEATMELQVTPAAPTIQAIPAQSVREGEGLVFDVNVLAPRLNPAEFDLIDINILEEPPGAIIEIIEDGPHKRIQLTWTPTFYDAGYHRLWIRANSSAAERMAVIDINVEEAGVPRVAAIGGTATRGVLTFYDYERTQGRNGVILRSGREIELGLGTGAAHVDADGTRVWVTVPGSNMVAVVSTAGNGAIIRRIPVGASPQGLVFGGGRLWVANHGDNSISAIDPGTMKVEFTVELDGEQGPSDLAWLSAELDGVAADRLAVVTDRSGHLVTIDPEAARSGIRPIASSQQIGGILSRIMVDSSTGDLHVADAKTRRVYRLAASELADGAAEVTGIDIDFAARDLLAHDGVLWIATGLNLLEVQGDDVEIHDLIQANALGLVGEAAISGGAIAIATTNRLENYMADTLNRVTETAGSRIRRVLTLVAPR